MHITALGVLEVAWEKFTVLPASTILLALQKIDENKKGFLIVVDKSGQVLGTLTDGDLRRSFLNGKTINDSVNEVINYNYEFVYFDSSFEEVTEIFKSRKVDFIPIVDREYKLVNIITKKQFHVLMLEDIESNLLFDFFSLDETKLEHEIFNRPWGFYKTSFLNKHTRAKIIKIYPKNELSLQEHKEREEHWVIIKGEGRLTIGDSVKDVNPGDYVFIPKGCKHRIENKSNRTLMISEVQLGDYFGEDDIIRYSDKYGRDLITSAEKE